MSRLAHTTFLVGQFSKLAQPWELPIYANGDGKNRPGLPADFWEILGCPPDLGHTAVFHDAGQTQLRLDQMSVTNLARLTEILADHHRNGVFKRIQERESWELREFDMNVVEVGYTEGDLKTAVSRHSHNLLSVAGDADVLQHPNYRDRDLKKPVPYEVFLAVWKPGRRPRLIDGNHRAIHKARQFKSGLNPQGKLLIVVPSD